MPPHRVPNGPSSGKPTQHEFTQVHVCICFFIFPTTYVFFAVHIYTLHLLKYTCNHVHLFAYSKITLIYLHLQHGI